MLDDVLVADAGFVGDRRDGRPGPVRLAQRGRRARSAPGAAGQHRRGGHRRGARGARPACDRSRRASSVSRSSTARRATRAARSPATSTRRSSSQLRPTAERSSAKRASSASRLRVARIAARPVTTALVRSRYDRRDRRAWHRAVVVMVGAGWSRSHPASPRRGHQPPHGSACRAWQQGADDGGLLGGERRGRVGALAAAGRGDQLCPVGPRHDALAALGSAS